MDLRSPCSLHDDLLHPVLQHMHVRNKHVRHSLFPVDANVCCACVQVGIIMQGMEAIRVVERWCAPVLLLLSAALLLWAHQAAAGGFGSMLATPSQFGPGMPKAGRFWQAFFPALTANVGYWATLSLNIPDFTRWDTLLPCCKQ